MSTSSVRRKAMLIVVMVAGVTSANPAGGATAIVAPSLITKSAQPHSGRVSSHFVLPAHRLVAGAHERGTLVIANSTGRPLRWNCGYLEVQLTNAQWPLELHPTPCGPGRTIPVGTTRLRFTLWAAHDRHGSWKPLPPGTYRTRLFPGLPAAVHPNPITVAVAAKPA